MESEELRSRGGWSGELRWSCVGGRQGQVRWSPVGLCVEGFVFILSAMGIHWGVPSMRVV